MERTPCNRGLKCPFFLKWNTCRYGHDHTPDEIRCALVDFLNTVKVEEQISALRSELNSHPEPDAPEDPLYKTVDCKNWKKDGTCPFGHKCRFAHGVGDLRAKPPSKPVPVDKVKTIRCRFDLNGQCHKGEDCDFLHGQDKPPKAGYRPREATLEKKLGELTL